MRFALIGFCWEPSLNKDPSELLNICEACQHAFLKAYAKAKNECLEAVYEKQKTAWIMDKMEGLEKARGRVSVGSARTVNRLSPAQEAMADNGRWNYSHNEAQKVWRF